MERAVSRYLTRYALVSPRQMAGTLAIAIDFGTSFSGISYKDVSRRYSEPAEHFTTWPGVSAIRTFHKIPTVVAYPKNGKKKVLWGFEAEELGPNPDEYFRCEMFKPHLHALSENIIAPGSSILPLPFDKTVNDVIRDYLDLLFNHFERTISDSYPLARYKYHILFTVPATFPEVTVRMFREIVEKTTMGDPGRNISFDVGNLTEPEAAAMYTINKQPGYQFEKGDCFVVCDAGGGTVDVCSYMIEDAAFPYKLDQAAVAKAAYCGSTMIDHAFKEFVKTEIGEDNLAKITYRERYALQREFIERKEQFSDDESRLVQYIPLPHSVSKTVGAGATGNIVEDMLGITREQMRKLFSRTIEETTKLLLSHIDKAKVSTSRKTHKQDCIKYVYLVGGLGTSTYFKNALQSNIRKTYPQIMIISPPAAHLAVVDGSARVNHQRLNPTIPNPIKSKMLQASYGVLVSKAYDPRMHHHSRKVVDPISGELLVKDHISWFVIEGDSYDGDEPTTVSKPLRRKFKKPAVFVEELVTTDADPSCLPTSKRDGNVRVVCRVESDFTRFGKKDFRKVKKDMPGTFGLLKRKTGYEATFALLMTLEAAKVVFSTRLNGADAGGVFSVEWNDQKRMNEHKFGTGGIPAQELEG